MSYPVDAMQTISRLLTTRGLEAQMALFAEMETKWPNKGWWEAMRQHERYMRERKAVTEP